MPKDYQEVERIVEEFMKECGGCDLEVKSEYEKVEKALRQALTTYGNARELEGVEKVNSILYVVDEEREGDITDHALSEMFETKLQAYDYGQKQYELDTRQALEELRQKLLAKQ